MSTGCCCNCNKEGVIYSNKNSHVQVKTGFIKKAINAVRLVLPGTLLALMPKCPLCLAAYISLSTGMGISVASATWLRALLAVACVTSLMYVAAKKLLISDSFIQLNAFFRRYLNALNYVMIALCILFATAWVNHI